MASNNPFYAATGPGYGYQGYQASQANPNTNQILGDLNRNMQQSFPGQVPLNPGQVPVQGPLFVQGPGPNPKKKFPWLGVALGAVVVLAIFGGTGYYLWKKNRGTEEEDKEDPEPTPTPKPVQAPPQPTTPRASPADERLARAERARMEESRMRASGVQDRVPSGSESRSHPSRGTSLADAFAPDPATSYLERIGELDPMSERDSENDGRPRRGNPRGRGGRRPTRAQDPMGDLWDQDRGDDDDFDYGEGPRRGPSLFDDRGDVFSERRGQGSGGRGKRGSTRGMEDMGRRHRLTRIRSEGDIVDVYGGDADDPYSTPL